MPRISIRSRLSLPYCVYFGIGVALLIVVSVALVNLSDAYLDNPAKHWIPAASIGLFWLILFGIVLVSFWRLVHMDRHPDLIALARYGVPDELLPQMEAELADPSQAVRIELTPGGFQLTFEVIKADVYLTRSWLIHINREGLWMHFLQLDRMHFLRLDRLVLVYREDRKMILADSFGVRHVISGSEAGRVRLMAEILVRVPWALNRFDPEIEKTWTEDRQAIVAQVEKRRRTLQQPATPG